MAKIWDKGYGLDQVVEYFTVGNDPELDLRLVAADCVGSVAHSRGLLEAGILDADQQARLESGLRGIMELHQRGDFAIAREQEDCHTAIEAHLTATLGEVGKKIHTGRSRNDQILTALRLFERDGLFSVFDLVVDTARAFIRRAEAWARVPLVGRTHMQPAMPSSFGLWAAAVAESLCDDAEILAGVLPVVDASPLGSAAGFGVPLPLDRAYTAGLLGFSRPHHTVLYAGNSRGKVEGALLDALDQVALTLGKLATDLLFYSLPEVGYVVLPRELCTGSSIMPQKKNPDLLELLRSRSHLVGSYSTTVKNIVRTLPGGYNRDFQDTKEPVIRAFDVVDAMLAVVLHTIDKVELDEAACRRAFDAGVFATDHALTLVAQGRSFRDAYGATAAALAEGGLVGADPDAALASRTGAGTAGNLDLAGLEGRIAAVESRLGPARERRDRAITALAGTPALFFRPA